MTELLLCAVVVILLVLGAGVVYLVVQSRNWTGPGQIELIREVQSEVDLVRRTVEAVDGSLRDWREDYLTLGKRIADQIRTVNVGVGKTAALGTRIADLETTIKNLPCMSGGDEEGDDEA